MKLSINHFEYQNRKQENAKKFDVKFVHNINIYINIFLRNKRLKYSKLARNLFDLSVILFKIVGKWLKSQLEASLVWQFGITFCTSNI